MLQSRTSRGSCVRACTCLEVRLERICTAPCVQERHASGALRWNNMQEASHHGLGGTGDMELNTRVWAGPSGSCWRAWRTPSRGS